MPKEKRTDRQSKERHTMASLIQRLENARGDIANSESPVKWIEERRDQFASKACKKVGSQPALYRQKVLHKFLKELWLDDQYLASLFALAISSRFFSEIRVPSMVVRMELCKWWSGLHSPEHPALTSLWPYLSDALGLSESSSITQSDPDVENQSNLGGTIPNSGQTQQVMLPLPVWVLGKTLDILQHIPEIHSASVCLGVDLNNMQASTLVTANIPYPEAQSHVQLRVELPGQLGIDLQLLALNSSLVGASGSTGPTVCLEERNLDLQY